MTEQTPQDSLHEQISEAVTTAHREWMRPGSDSGQHLMTDAITLGVIAVIQPKLETATRQRDHHIRQRHDADESSVEWMKAAEKAAATIERVRAVLAASDGWKVNAADLRAALDGDPQ